MDIDAECYPFPKLSGFHSVTGFDAWSEVVGHKNRHTILASDTNKLVFGLRGTNPESFFNQTNLERCYKKWAMAAAGMKLLANYNFSVVMDCEFSMVEAFEMNSPITWMPIEGKFASLHHYMSANIFASLLFQRESDETHFIECGLCNYLNVTEKPQTIVELYLHGRKFHVQNHVSHECYIVGTALLDDVTRLPIVSFDNNVGVEMKNVKSEIKHQRMIRFS